MTKFGLFLLRHNPSGVKGHSFDVKYRLSAESSQTLLKARCHVPFTNASSALQCGSKDFTWVDQTKKNSLKMHCTNRMWQLGFNHKISDLPRNGANYCRGHLQKGFANQIYETCAHYFQNWMILFNSYSLIEKWTYKRSQAWANDHLRNPA